MAEQIVVQLRSEIDVGSFTYELRHGKAVTDDLASGTRFSEISGYLKRISLDDTLSEQQQDNDFIHEVVHAINQVYLDGELEERQVKCVSNGFHQVLKQLGVTFRLQPSEGG